MTDDVTIRSPDSEALAGLCAQLGAAAAALDVSPRWPAEQLRQCARRGVFGWFVPRRFGGAEWDEVDIARGYLRLAASCLTTTFVLTQWAAACRRIADSPNDPLAARLLPDLLAGRALATVGISHLTTSRRHLVQPVMRVRSEGQSLVFDGYSPWVTGGGQADVIVTGGTLDDGRQVLVALPTDLPGVVAEAPQRLLALSASCTGAVTCRGARVPRAFLLAGPEPDVMGQGGGGGTGGLPTSTLALGLATAAIDYLKDDSARRPELAGPAERLAAERAELVDLLLDLAAGGDGSAAELRAAANSLALRAAQAALAAAKGAGYAIGHPAGRWCREALFFLVWSCPQPVVAANLCELAGIAE